MLTKLLHRLGSGDRAVRRLLLGGMALGFAALIAAGAAAVWITGRIQDHTFWVNHTYEVELAIANLGRANEQAETARRGYILTSDTSYLDNYRLAAEQLRRRLADVSRLTADNPVQHRNMGQLQAVTAELVAARGATNALVETGRLADANRAFSRETSARRMRAVREIGTRMASEERRLLTYRDTQQVGAIRLFYIVMIAAGLLVAFVAVASLLTVLRYTRDLGASRAALEALNESLEDTVADRTADLTRANEEIQRFAYIVSHDLRSPLVNVMGFTSELDAATAAIATLIERAEAEAPQIVTEEARLAAREDLPEAIGFIRTSTQKMDRLINAILKLSREGRRTITPEAIDLAGMGEAIGAALKQQMDAREVTYVVAAPFPALTSDRLGVEQILSNLVENAVKYLQPGRPGAITVSARRDRGRVLIDVADNGRGIDPRDHQRVFDLFRRSGMQDQPGEGIGLAHVRAMAYRLGGTIDVDSTPGKGSTFRVSLPAVLEV